MREFAQLLNCPREIRIIFGCKVLESTSYFCFAVILVKFLSEELGVSDQNAGWIYGCFGTTVSLIGLLTGFVIDNFGVRISLIAACGLLAASRIVVAFAGSTVLVVVVLLSTCSVGQALCQPVLTMALRRYTDENLRQFAFSLFYVCQNLSYAIGAFIIHGVRLACSQAQWKLPPYRVALLYGAIGSGVCLILATTVREIRANKGGGVESFLPRRASSYSISKEVVSQPKFWRLLAICVLFLGVQMNFHHMNVSFPKYYTREFGGNAPFELLLAINPIMIVCLVPTITHVVNRLRWEFDAVLVCGALISGISPFALAISNSTWGAVMWMVLLSLGEAIWSPKLMELSVAVAPEGREGTYMSLTSFPLLFSKIGVGGLSGALLSQYCPAQGPRNPRMMWFIIGCTTAPLGLVLAFFRRKLFVPEDWAQKDQDDDDLMFSTKGHNDDIKLGRLAGRATYGSAASSSNEA